MYTNQMKSTDWIYALSTQGMNLNNAITNGKLLSDKFNSLTYGLSDEQILALPQLTGWTAADLNTYRYGVGVFNTIQQAMNNTAITPSNLYAYLEPFL
jgi:hypothetical protein